MKTIFGVILILLGISGLVQSFRKEHTRNAAMDSGIDPNTAGRYQVFSFIFGAACLGGGIYLFMD